jgi:hypothetical protein
LLSGAVLASKIAPDATRAESEPEFRALAAKLPAACDGRYATYQKPG